MMIRGTHLFDPVHGWNRRLGSFKEGVSELHGEALHQRRRRPALHLTVEAEQHPVPGNDIYEIETNMVLQTKISTKKVSSHGTFTKASTKGRNLASVPVQRFL